MKELLKIKEMIKELFNDIPCKYYSPNGDAVPMSREDIMKELIKICDKIDVLIQ